ncbi:MAG TPA: adenylate/guanylate cyclase domain-containing protein, partial [Gammaproteobacteria bacterium]|nr:adenylate/guanylate cyclase domain-containing protein [Gammaproteobacteria bacterium]
LDIHFKEQRKPAVDATLARAIEESGRVILFQYTKKDITRLYDQTGHYSGELIAQRLTRPAEPIASAPLALAPFPLPVFPIKVSQFWAYTPGTGDLPTEPVVALQLYTAAHYPDLLALIRQVDPNASLPPVQTTAGLFEKHATPASIQAVRKLFRERPSLLNRITTTLDNDDRYAANTGQRTLLHALIAMYGKADSRYLNFYGPPQTLTTVPFVQILQPDIALPGFSQAPNLQGKTVFVGYSERLQPEQLDEFYTVYSQNNGLHLSGVEIAATAFANLLQNNPVRPLPLPAQYLLLASWGLMLGCCVRLLPVFPAITVSMGLTALYLVASQLLFNLHAIWLPLLVPLLIQGPFALFMAIIWHYHEVRQERESIRTAFGLYLPAPVVDELANDLAKGKSEAQLVYGTCLSTDADKYTSLSEGMDPAALAELMNAYYETLFTPVRQYGGIVSDVVGDAMLALWTSSTPESKLRHKAILAALAINEAVRQPEVGHIPHHLPTRVGLHTGQVLLGSIGAIDHFEYRAVGDIVNTSTRIQGMNTYLGTRVLLTQQMLEGIDDFVTRDVGSFVLAGKTQALVIHELIGRRDTEIDAAAIEQQQFFAEGLATFRRGDWAQAQKIFTQHHAVNRNDGVSRYYVNLCRHQQPDKNWNGAIRLDTK